MNFVHFEEIPLNCYKYNRTFVEILAKNEFAYRTKLQWILEIRIPLEQKKIITLNFVWVKTMNVNFIILIKIDHGRHF